MTDALSRAQRSDTEAPAKPSYLWEVAGKPVSVRISFEIIDRLEHEAVENFRSINARGSEIGGLLLGSCAPGSPACVSVEDFETIACDYSRGPLYRLSDADMGRFDEAIERRAAARGLRVVGFFRSHTRKGLAIDADDLLLFGSRFRDPNNIGLLIRPFATKASAAGIFIWENGQVRGDASYLEFPFQSAQLAPARPAAPAQRPPAGATPASAPATPAPAPIKTPVRAKVVPMTSRFEIAVPEAPLPRVDAPAPQPEQTPDMPAARPETTPTAAALAPTPAPATPAAAAPSATAATPASVRPAVDDRPPAAPMESTPSATPATAAEAAAEPRSRKTLLLWGAVAAALLATSGMLFVYPGVLRHASGKPLIPLTLRVEHSASDLLLTWNRDSDAIRGARQAILAISDGQRQENIEMNLNDLHNGSIVYSPLTADVSFRMDVTGADSSKIASESVRVLRTRPSPMPQEGDTAGQTTQAANTQPAASSAPAAAEPQSQPADAESEAPTPNRASSPARPFNAASLAQRLRPAQPTDLPDAPTLASGAGAGTVNLSAITKSPSPVLSPVAAPPSAKQQARSSTLQQAQILTRVTPEYPTLARQSGAAGEVRLVATIGPDGRVKSVKVLSGHALLQRAAMDAVQRWTYKPALLNGQAVESTSEVVVNFSRQQ